MYFKSISAWTFDRIHFFQKNFNIFLMLFEETGDKCTKFYPNIIFKKSNSTNIDDFNIIRKKTLSRTVLSKSEKFLARRVGVATNCMLTYGCREKDGLLEIFSSRHFPIISTKKLKTSDLF